MKAPNGAVLNWLMDAMSIETDACLIVPFAAGAHGYVPVTVNGVQYLCHRYVCTLAHGVAPSGLQAAHSCGNKRCVNKRHLRWATRKENEADKLLHGTRLRGERHPHNKLSTETVLAIRAATGSQRAVAKKFNVAQQTVSDIQTRRRWTWL